ncbi:MAG TPA: hypothetical protein EYP28_03945 [Methanophagales archaeon]|nr:hypothetical protein [Methanophagales archaeon]
MKNKQRALVLAVLFITAIFIVNSYADPGTAKTKTIVGFAGVPTTEFSKAKELGAETTKTNCGNGICEPGENRSICPADCKEFKNVFNGN